MSLTPAKVPTVNAWSNRLVLPKGTETKCKKEYIILPGVSNEERTSGSCESRDLSQRSSEFPKNGQKKMRFETMSPIYLSYALPRYCSSLSPSLNSTSEEEILHPTPVCVPQFLVDPIRFAQTEWTQAKENGLVLEQLAYYFSPANLSRDTHLCSLFDDDGYVMLRDLLKLKRLANLLGRDLDRLFRIVHYCPFLELTPGDNANKAGVRVHDWHKWVPS